MNYIVLDLEWNQSSNQRDKEYGIPFEILEIGAVKLNENKEIIGKFDQLIKPQIYQTIHFITTKIIHIDKEELSNGKPFQEVAKAFLDWCGKDYIFCTWGTLDLTEFQRNLCYYGMDEISKGQNIPASFLPLTASLNTTMARIAVNAGGALFFASANKSLTREAPTPTNISTKSEPDILKKGTPASPATALAKRVLPVPGGPISKTPFGILAPTWIYFCGVFKKSTISCSSSFSSSRPATFLNVILLSSFDNLARLFPKFITFPPPAPA